MSCRFDSGARQQKKGLSNKYSWQGHCIWRRSFHKAAMSKCPIPLYVVVSTKLNHPEITFGTAPGEQPTPLHWNYSFLCKITIIAVCTSKSACIKAAQIQFCQSITVAEHIGHVSYSRIFRDYYSFHRNRRL